MMTLIALALAAAHFGWFDYRGQNSDAAVTKTGEFRNPILAGFHSDPSLLRVGKDYYLVTSTFAYFPGLPIFHSRDLIHWQQIGNAIDRPDQVDFGKLEMSRGLFAASISYHDGKFLIVNTCVDCGGNFVISASNPAGPWSDPVWLKGLDGAIDPSLFFAPDGTRWVVFNGAPPGTPRYEGHRAIRLQQVDAEFQPVGAPTPLLDGGVHPEANPVWIEGPHLLSRDGWIYLIAAEGGTAENHSEVVLRSRSVTGPYEAFSGNPILTQRDLRRDRANPVTSAGHAQFVETPDGKWWASFLATRPYQGDDYNIGRETFLMPVRWKDGWPRVTDPGQAIPLTLPAPGGARARAGDDGSVDRRDEFTGAAIGPEWMMMRNPRSRWYHVSGGALTLDARPVSIGDSGNPSFLGRRLQHPNATVTTRVTFVPQNEGDEAGLVAIQNDAFWLFAGVGRHHGRDVVMLKRRAGTGEPKDGLTLASSPVDVGRPLELRMAMVGATARFSWRQEGAWQPLGDTQDSSVLSTRRAGGFVGALAGVYARSGEHR